MNETDNKFIKYELILDEILQGMDEASYDAPGQLSGYLVYDDLSFLSGRTGARGLARKWGREKMLSFLLDWYLVHRKKDKEEEEAQLLERLILQIEKGGCDPLEALYAYFSALDLSHLPEEGLCRELIRSIPAEDLLSHIARTYMEERKLGW